MLYTISVLIAVGSTVVTWSDQFGTQPVGHYSGVVGRICSAQSDQKKLKRLKVRLTRKVQTAFQRLHEEARGNYKEAKKALQKEFELKSHQSRYHTEFQTRTKQKLESWARTT